MIKETGWVTRKRNDTEGYSPESVRYADAKNPCGYNLVCLIQIKSLGVMTPSGV
jgi:hypothetical protein